jgi:hypothetical protein
MGDVIPTSTHFFVSAPASVITGTPFSVTVSVLDGACNLIIDYTGTVHFTSTDSGAGLPADYKFVAGNKGVHTFNGIRLMTLGSQTVTATDTVTGTITGTSNLMTVKQHFWIEVDSAHGDPTVSAWVDQGSSFTAWVSSPAGVTNNHQFVCFGYVLDGGALTTGTSYTFDDVQAAHTLTFQWKEQYYVTFKANGLASSAAGAVLTVGGTIYTYNDLPLQGWFDRGTSFQWTTPVPDTTGTSYVLMSPAASTIKSPGSYTAMYKTQY